MYFRASPWRAVASRVLTGRQSLGQPLDLASKGNAASLPRMVVSLSAPRHALHLNVAHQATDFVALSHKNLLLLSWRGPEDPAVCRSLYATAVRVAAEVKASKLAIVSIVNPGCKRPSKEASDAMSQLHDDPQGIIHRSALVFRSDGIFGVAMHSIAMSIMQRGKRRLKHDIFLHLDRALTWVTEGLPTPDSQLISVSDVVFALEEYLSGAWPRTG
jgi:hypothetical protein